MNVTIHCTMYMYIRRSNIFKVYVYNIYMCTAYNVQYLPTTHTNLIISNICPLYYKHSVQSTEKKEPHWTFSMFSWQCSWQCYAHNHINTWAGSLSLLLVTSIDNFGTVFHKFILLDVQNEQSSEMSQNWREHLRSI